jgi:hypothetical protein
MNNIIQISDITIRIDYDGRFSLNDLHRASGGEKRHQPSNWLMIQQTKELISALENAPGGTPGIPVLEQNQPVSAIHGGDSRGTYVVKELVYAYAMWISPQFHLQVIRAYDAMTEKLKRPTTYIEALKALIETEKAKQAAFAAAQAA